MSRMTKAIATSEHTEAKDNHEETAAANMTLRRKFLIGAPFAVAAAFLVKQPEVAHARTDGDWSLTGNAITAAQFLGTTNAQPLNFRTSYAAQRRRWTEAKLLGTVPSSKAPVAVPHNV